MGEESITAVVAEEIDVQQLATYVDDEEDTELTLSDSMLIAPGMVLPKSAFLVIGTKPPLIRTKYLRGYTKIILNCSIQPFYSLDNVLDKVLVACTSRVHQHGLRLMQRYFKDVRNANGTLFLYSGQKLPLSADHSFVVQRCDPPTGIVTNDTEFYFSNIQPQVLQNITLMSVHQTSTLQDGSYIGPKQIIKIPVNNKPLCVSQRSTARTAEQVRQARLEYLEHRDLLRAFETEIIEVVAIDTVPAVGGIFDVDVTLVTWVVAPAETAPQENNELMFFDRCDICQRRVNPPNKSSLIFRCPCGQPRANALNAAWRSVEQATDQGRSSLVFLRDLRTIIGVIPMDDPRTSVLHTSLNLFTRLPDGSFDFDVADRLVQLAIPRTPSVGVPNQVINRFPCTTYSDFEMKLGENSCAICMEAYHLTDIMRTLPCFHFFHRQCIDRWFRLSQQCPTCKYEIS